MKNLDKYTYDDSFETFDLKETSMSSGVWHGTPVDF